MVEQKKRELNLKLLFGGTFVLSLILSLGVIISFNLSQKRKVTISEPKTAEEIEKAVNDLQSELDTLDQIEEELNSPELELDLGL